MPAAAASRLDAETVRRCIESPAEFFKVILGVELWPWQRQVAEDPAKFRVILGGRQIGKSSLLGGLALHAAWRFPGAHVLVASTIDDAAKRLMDSAVTLARGSVLLRDSVTDDLAHLLTLSNGSTVRSIPSSIRQAIGWTVDFLVADESGYLDEAFWEHLEPVIAARPGARVICASTPWGGPEHWFRRLWSRGMDAPDAWCRAWQLPATVSPLIDKQWLEEKRKTASDEFYRRTVLGEWTETAGTYFTEQELMDSVVDYELADPADRRRWGWHREGAACAGLDWAFSRDANVAVLLSVLDDGEVHGRDVFYVPWLEAHYGLEYSAFANRVHEIATTVRTRVIASECNGVGAPPTQDLQRRFMYEGLGEVHPVWTDARRKMSGFAKIRSMMQGGQLILPRHSELLSQLRSLTFEQLPSGVLKIAAPGSRHDDYPMALLQAVSCVEPHFRYDGSPFRPEWMPEGRDATPRGVWCPDKPRPRPDYLSAFRLPEGRERSAESQW